MPELPEVETIKLDLEKRIVGLEITKVEILNSKSFLGEKDLVQRKRVASIWRRGKVLGINLSPTFTLNLQPDRVFSLSLPALYLLFHLKMSGQVIMVPKDRLGVKVVGGHPNSDMQSKMPVKSTRVIFTFNNGDHLYFNDQRKFGWVKVVEGKFLANDRFLSSLGPEPLKRNFNWGKLKENLFKHKKSPVKSVILDQSVIAGIGNIYACEALFLSGIDPKRQVASLSDREIKRMLLSIKSTLKSGIKFGGSSITHFVNVEGRKGGFLQFAKVYNREGQPCIACGSEIKKIKLGGRGTYFCQKCQK